MPRPTRLWLLGLCATLVCLHLPPRLFAQGTAPQPLAQSATTFFQQGQWARAAEAFAQAAAQQLLPAAAYVQWGAALAQLKRPEDAIGKFTQALALNPQEALAYRHWGFALGELGRYADAIEKFQQALTLNPQDVRAHYGWGVALYLLGRAEEARPKFQQALTLDPKLLSPDAQRTLQDTGLLEDAATVTPRTR